MSDHQNCQKLTKTRKVDDNTIEVIEYCRHDPFYEHDSLENMISYSDASQVLPNHHKQSIHYIHTGTQQHLGHNRQIAIARARELSKLQQTTFEHSHREQGNSSAYYEQGQHIWNNGLKREAKNQTEAATGHFEEALTYFASAASFEPGNVEYTKHHRLAQCKVQGDKHFNDAISLQKDERHAEAKIKYSDALKVYQEGDALNESVKFISFARYIKEVKVELEKLEDIIEKLKQSKSGLVLGELNERIEANNDGRLNEMQINDSELKTVFLR